MSRVTTGLFYSAVVLTALVLNSVAASEPKMVKVEITTHLGDQQAFVEGDVISFLLSLDQEAYIYLFYQDAAGNNILIFPNQENRNHFYQKGLFMPLPPQQTRFQFKIQAPFGQEKLFVFASNNADIQLENRSLDNGLSLINGSVDNLHSTIRDQSDKAFGTTEMVLVSQPR